MPGRKAKGGREREGEGGRGREREGEGERGRRGRKREGEGGEGREEGEGGRGREREEREGEGGEGKHACYYPFTLSLGSTQVSMEFHGNAAQVGPVLFITSLNACSWFNFSGDYFNLNIRETWKFLDIG